MRKNLRGRSSLTSMPASIRSDVDPGNSANREGRPGGRFTGASRPLPTGAIAYLLGALALALLLTATIAADQQRAFASHTGSCGLHYDFHYNPTAGEDEPFIPLAQHLFINAYSSNIHYNAFVDWGDGTPVQDRWHPDIHFFQTGPDSRSYRIDAYHTYASTGTYNATVLWQENDNGTIYNSRNCIHVTVVPPGGGEDPEPPAPATITVTQNTSHSATWPAGFPGGFLFRFYDPSPNNKIVYLTHGQTPAFFHQITPVSLGGGYYDVFAPPHTYSTWGNYTIYSHVFDYTGSTPPQPFVFCSCTQAFLTVQTPFTLNGPPVASLSADIYFGSAPLTVSFSRSGSFDPNNDIVSWALNFGDGSAPASGAWPAPASIPHTYPTSGDYDAVLTLTDTVGLSDTSTVSIHVEPTGSGEEPQPAVVEFYAPNLTNAQPGVEFTRRIINVYAPSLNHKVANIYFGHWDGVNQTVWDAPMVPIGDGHYEVWGTYTYPSTGLKTVSVTVIDYNGDPEPPTYIFDSRIQAYATGNAEIVVTTTPLPPTVFAQLDWWSPCFEVSGACASGAPDGSASTEFTFNAVAWGDAGITSVEWDFDGDGSSDESTAVAGVPQSALVSTSHVYGAGGAYTPWVRAIDSLGKPSGWQPLVVGGVFMAVDVEPEEAPPQAEMQWWSPCFEASSACAPGVPDGGPSTEFTFTADVRAEAGIDRVEWDFDGDSVVDTLVTMAGETTSVVATATHTYGAIGSFVPGVRVTDFNGTDTGWVTFEVGGSPVTLDVDSPPLADAGGPYEVDLGGSLDLDGSGSSDPDAPVGDSFTYFWDIDADGTSDVSSDSPYVTLDWAALSAFGPFVTTDPITGLPEYTLTLTVTDAAGLSSPSNTSLRIYDNRPIPVITADPNPAACDQTVTFDATGSTHGHPGHSIIRYEWDYGDGNSDDSGAVVAHAFGQFGTFLITLRVFDDNSPERSGESTLTIEVDQGNEPPVALPGGPYTVELGGEVELDGNSSDPNEGCGDTVSYSWDLGSGSATGSVEGQAPTISASTIETLGAGLHPVRLTVTDSFGLIGEAWTTLTVLPPIEANAGGPYLVIEGGEITLQGECSNCTSFEWDRGNDGVFESTGPTAAFAAPFVNSTQVLPVVLRVCDELGRCAADSTDVQVTNLGPTGLDAGGPYAVNEGSSVGLNGSCGDCLTFAWDLDDDGTFESPGPLALFHAPAVPYPSTRTVRLRACDGDGLCDVSSADVLIANLGPTGVDAGGPYSVNEGGDVTLGATCGGDCVDFAWDLDGDDTFETVGDSVAFHAPLVSGPSTRTVWLRACDFDGLCAVSDAQLDIVNLGPTGVNAGGPYSVSEGSDVTLEASCGDDCVLFEWDLDGDGTFETPGQPAAFSAVDGPATPTVRVRACDNDGLCGEASAVVNVTNVAPQVTAAWFETSPIEGEPVALQGRFHDPGLLDSHEASIDWGDGTSTTLPVGPGLRQFAESHEYAAVGVYAVTVCVTDDDGDSDCLALNVTVNPFASYDSLSSLVESSVENRPHQSTLLATLERAQQFGNRGRHNVEQNMLDTFIRQVSAFSPRWLSPSDAAALIEMAEELLAR